MEKRLTHNIKTIKEIQHECWKRYHVASPNRRIKLLSLFKNTTVSLDKFYRSAPSLEKMKKETKSAKQKLTRVKISAQTAIAEHVITNIG